MPKKSAIPLRKETIRFFEGDTDTLQEFYPQIGFNRAIRELVSQHCKALRERQSRETQTNVRSLAADVDLAGLDLGALLPAGPDELDA